MSPHPDNPFCGEDRRAHNSLRTEGPLQRIDLLTTCPRHVGSDMGYCWSLALMRSMRSVIAVRS